MVFYKNFSSIFSTLLALILFTSCTKSSSKPLNVFYTASKAIIKYGSLWEKEFYRPDHITTLGYFIDSQNGIVYINYFSFYIYALKLSNGEIIYQYPLSGKVYGKYQKYKIEKVGKVILFSSQQNFLVFSEDLELKDELIRRILRENPWFDASSIIWTHTMRNDSIIFIFREDREDDMDEGEIYIDSVAISLKDYQ